jgi:hypothetical protein
VSVKWEITSSTAETRDLWRKNSSNADGKQTQNNGMTGQTARRPDMKDVRTTNCSTPQSCVKKKENRIYIFSMRIKCGTMNTKTEVDEPDTLAK